MIIRKPRRSPARYFLRSARQSSPALSTGAAGLSDCDADDEENMSTDGYSPPRPLSVAIPDQLHYARRPTLAEVLSNTSPAPYTLTAFMAFLSQNHCLETLEFTMDASRYQKHYDQTTQSGPNGGEGQAYVMMLWQRLLAAYIVPNGPREVNLPGDIRDQLLSQPTDASPPSPAALEPAVKIIYDLMDESAFVPFLNSVPLYREAHSYPLPWRGSDEETSSRASGEESNLRAKHTRRPSSPPRPMDLLSSSLPSSGGSQQSRPSRTSNLTAGLSRGMRTSPHISSSSGGSGDNLTDDSGSASSPGREPMTPPNTPPTSDVSGSPRSRGQDNTWKKMTGKLGWKKRSTGGLRDANNPSWEDEGGLL
ncbi:MAG: hypothetical protein M1825_006298 [Sarcosagium campestre]|nr:MAG: hypothetical protein M1825_006298 [Sarcosagium campestre]